MARRRVLDRARLAERYAEGRRAKDPTAVAYEIDKAARTPGRLAPDLTPTDALTIAAELARVGGATAEALRMVEAALSRRAPDDRRVSAPALHAVLLADAGRQGEAYAILYQLRDLIGMSYEASTVVPEALERIGATDLALEWLGAAIDALDRRIESADFDGTPEATVNLDQRMRRELAATLRRLRGPTAGQAPDTAPDTDRAPDPDTGLGLDAEAEPAGPPGTASLRGPTGQVRLAILFWPRSEYDAMARMWPELAEGYGSGSWPAHRDEVATMLRGHPAPAARLDPAADRLVVPARLHDYLDYTAENGLDPVTPRARTEYAASLARRGFGVPYPPARGATCWCGSGQKFRRCCGRRAEPEAPAPGWTRFLR